ncbi:MAG: hypothetical protein NWE82_00375 [Candidatus Bathyarchaeota archaeon]|nr:hypothetical protein [Candidatus Bathyarchaeota archaeon]
MGYMLRSTRGISTISLIILLLASAIVGAVLSYLWTAGYYVELGLHVPENTTTVAITNMTFLAENSAYFRVTVMNPTYSEGDAEITGIALVGTALGFAAVNATDPSIPYSLKRGESMTFRCDLNWGDFAGEEVNVTVFIRDGSGAASSYLTEFVKLEITDLAYNSFVTVEQFNMTIRNRSDIPLDLSKVIMGVNEIPQNEISVDGESITFPYGIPQNESRVLVCNWRLWDSETDTGVLGTTTKVTAETSQGYRAVLWEAFSDPVSLAVSNVTFPTTNTTQFTLRSHPQSPHGVNLSQVTVTVGTQTYTVTAENTNATDFFLPRDFNVTILCEDSSFNWETWKDQTITIRVYTTQGFLVKKEEVVP